MKQLSFSLKMPPTANNLFPTGKNGRRFPSKAYTAWKAVAALDILQQCRGVQLTGRIDITYVFCFSDKRARDIANFEKATTDALVDAGVIRDDCDIDKLTLHRGVIVDNAYVTVKISSIQGAS